MSATSDKRIVINKRLKGLPREALEKCTLQRSRLGEGARSGCGSTWAAAGALRREFRMAFIFSSMRRMRSL